MACTVLVADCLPVLMAARDGRAVAAAHAGWRGLAGGVLEAHCAALCTAARCDPAQVVGLARARASGRGSFEVGADVLQAFGQAPGTADPQRFVASVPRPTARRAGWPTCRSWRATGWRSAGRAAVSGGSWCTVEDASRFFSFRRDGVTGRLAAAIWSAR